jgi:uncharacterized protein
VARRDTDRTWHTRHDSAGADAAADAAGTVQRYDFAGESLLPPRRGADGALLFEGRIARPGILHYVDAAGNVTRELLPEDELHRADSLGTLGRVAVTLEHPEEDVTPDNVARLGVGDVDGVIDATEAGGFVRIRLAVRRRDAQQAIDAGKVELSPGYKCQVDATPGVHPRFGPYDAVQRGRVYNHVAIVDRARGGNEIRLRTDGAAYQIQGDNTMNPKLLALLALLGADKRDSDAAAIDEIDRVVRERIKADAAKADAAKADAAKADADANKTDASKCASKEDEIAVLKAERDRLAGQLSTLQGVVDAFRSKADAAERADLLEVGKRIDGFDANQITDTTSIVEVRKAVAGAHLARLGASLPAEASEDFVRGILTMIPKADAAEIDPWRHVGKGEAVAVDAAVKAAAVKADTAAGNVAAANRTPSENYFARCDAAFHATARNTGTDGGAA